MKATPKEIRLKASPICSGIAIGRPFLFLFSDEQIPEFFIQRKDINLEIERYRSALCKSRHEIEHLQKQLAVEGADEGVDILDAHLEIMHDDLITGYLENQIASTQKNAEYVFRAIMGDYEKKMSQLTGALFKERIKDVKDISKRIMRNLKKSATITLADIPQGSIVFAKDLAPSEAAEAYQSHVEAFVTEHGGVTSHTAIIARSKGIPYVSCESLGSVPIHESQLVIVDGRLGEIIFDPTQETLNSYLNLKDEIHLHMKRLAQQAQKKVATQEGQQVELLANIEYVSEAHQACALGAEGIGLFRSEFLCLKDSKIPSEETQFKAYKKLIDALSGKPLTIRTFDLGGDKSYTKTEMNEQNPFLGCRGIRHSLAHVDLFKSQLRAVLRASAFGPVRLMFPMITSSLELIRCKTLLKEVKEELLSKKVPFSNQIEIGSVIEVPSAALTCDELAKHCDFFSIGTNDLVQYSLAVDRGNQSLKHLYDSAHPSVIRLIQLVVQEAQKAGKAVSVCGEMAADPRFTTLLLGLGVRQFSCTPRYIPIIKNMIEQVSVEKASQMADEILQMSCSGDIEERLREEYTKLAPKDLLHNFS